VLLVDKPPGISSARAVARVKRLLHKGTRIGHTGTLDPLASGLLMFLLGRATRLSRYVTGLDKEYVATARFGATSTTLDAEGEITPLPDAPEPTEDGLRAATQRLTGNLEQIPPMASAVKVGGERLYKAHRRGEVVERRPRAITVTPSSSSPSTPKPRARSSASPAAAEPTSAPSSPTSRHPSTQAPTSPPYAAPASATSPSKKPSPPTNSTPITYITA
jgi:tRNA pseudouridine55 synthase